MINLKKTTAAIITGALALSLASCSNKPDTPNNRNRETNPSVSVEVPPPKDTSFGLAGLAAVKYSDYAPSDTDDAKTLESKIETKYGVDIVYGDDIRTEFGSESEQLKVEKYTDEENIKKALTTIDGILKVYPKTFFYQLRLQEVCYCCKQLCKGWTS